MLFVLLVARMLETMIGVNLQQKKAMTTIKMMEKAAKKQKQSNLHINLAPPLDLAQKDGLYNVNRLQPPQNQVLQKSVIVDLIIL